MKIICVGCKDEIKDPIWYQRNILNQMVPEIEFVHSHCREVLDCFGFKANEWEETSHMLIASRALIIARDALNAIGHDPRTSNIKKDGRFFGAFTFANELDFVKTLMNEKHEVVKRKLEEEGKL
jgi:hypothetical protein